MNAKNEILKSKEKVSKILGQAKDSLKVLEALEKEALAKAKGFVKIPARETRKKLTNDKILASLRKLGVATQSEVDALKQRVKTLESALSKLTKNSEK
jgi:polyhydroxyalkanoate synthesis regulator phasin